MSDKLCTDEQLRKYYPCECQDCGWRGCSCELTEQRYFDDADIFCPKCGSNKIEDCDNLISTRKDGE